MSTTLVAQGDSYRTAAQVAQALWLKDNDENWARYVEKLFDSVSLDWDAPGLRLGQRYMNALSVVDKDAYTIITDDSVECRRFDDPYYDNDKLHAFIDRVFELYIERL